jgi:phosphate transport system protein
MSKHLTRDLDQLNRDILSLSSMVEEMIGKACRALARKDIPLANQVIESDYEIDQREVRIEEECLKILALHQPVAVDLRRTATVMKVNNDLERIADLAVNIAERAKRLAEVIEFPIPIKLEHMAQLATSMVSDALNSLVNLDPDAARSVCMQDDGVDFENREVIDELLDLMKQRPDWTEAALHCFSASRHVERIADHATNIAEDVIYLVEGEIARHKYDHQEPVR